MWRINPFNYNKDFMLRHRFGATFVAAKNRLPDADIIVNAVDDL